MKIKGLGIDIIQNSRMKLKLATKFLTSNELLIYDKLNSSLEKKEFLCGRWTAKEAFLKATDKKWKFSEVSILKLKSGKPIIWINDIKRNDFLVSISHEKNYTVSMVLWQ